MFPQLAVYCQLCYMTDHSCGYCSLLPNLLRDFGWNPGKKIYNWFGDKVKSKTNNADLTFKEVNIISTWQTFSLDTRYVSIPV